MFDMSIIFQTASGHTITFNDLGKSISGDGKMSEGSEKVIKQGDWVRILRNTVGAISPHNEGQTAVPYEGIRVAKVEARSGRNGDRETVLYYMVGRSSSYLPEKDVERIEDCICAGPVKNVLGCRCGYETMKNHKVKKAQGN
jgi:hypothetical protein